MRNDTAFVKSEIQDHVLQVVLARPELHNAFNPEMIQELTEIFRRVAGQKNIRAAVISGEGKSFCAGADLNWMKSMVKYSYDQNIEDSKKLFEMYETIFNCPIPVIGKVHGNAFGGGVGLVAVCDLVAAQSDSKFCFSEVRLGLVPAVISPFVSRKTARPGLLRELMLTAEAFDASRAQDVGLVSFVGEQEEVEDFVAGRVDFICGNGPEAIAETKALLNFLPSRTWAEVRAQTTKVISERRVSKEGQEGLNAFLEKKKPSWVSKKGNL